MDKVLNYFQTTDYSRFKFLDYNRTAGSNKMLIKSMELVDMTEFVPIIVTPDFYIIDGQNRFLVCKEKGLPISYVIYNGDAEKAMIALNTALKPWKQYDWLTYYCNKGDERYLKLKRLYEDHRVTNLASVILLFSQNTTDAAAFREGKLSDKSDLYEEIVSFLYSIDVPRDVKWYRAFVNGVLRFFQKYRNEPKKIAKLKRKIPAITKFSRVDDYMMAFENWVR